jgi:hypothetical protein
MEWISLWERLPPTDTTVFVGDERTKEVALFQWTFLPDIRWSDMDVHWTHWMPLPEPPA